MGKIFLLFLLVTSNGWADAILTNSAKGVRLHVETYNCGDSSTDSNILAGEKEVIVALPGSTWVCHFSKLYSNAIPKDSGQKETIYNYGASVSCIDTKHYKVSPKESADDWMIQNKHAVRFGKNCPGYYRPWTPPVIQPSGLSLMGCSDVKKFETANKCGYVEEASCGYSLSLDCSDKVEDEYIKKKYAPFLRSK